MNYKYHLVWNGHDEGMCVLRYHRKGYLFESAHGNIIIPFASVLSEYHKLDNDNVNYFEIETE